MTILKILLFIFVFILLSCQQTKKIVNKLAPTEKNRGIIKYELTKFSLKNNSVPQGKVINMGIHISSKFYPGIQRKWRIYIPYQYNNSTPAKLLIINDGENFLKKKGNPVIVMDNLIAAKKIPIIIAIFIDPGVSIKKDKNGSTLIKNRSNEYDTCSPKYATFLEEEILKEVYKKYNISKKAKDHAIMGSSSGGSCAFTAAWHRNDLFQKVISFIGSFCDFSTSADFPDKSTEYEPLKRADEYPSLIRKTPSKDIRIFIQSGSSDLDNFYGNWYLNNQRLVKALKFAKYDYKVVWGKDGHSSNHGVSLLPEIFQWIWQEN